MRLIAITLLCTVMSMLVPLPSAAVTAFRLPHETVSGSNRDADYTLSIQGGGLALQSFNFADPAVRPVCFQFWQNSADTVITIASAMARGGRPLPMARPSRFTSRSHSPSALRGPAP
jgi:hypothetical protein